MGTAKGNICFFPERGGEMATERGELLSFMDAGAEGGYKKEK